MGKQTCECGCFLGLSSCLSTVTMLLELTVAILTLTAKSSVIKSLCEKVQKGVWSDSDQKCMKKSGVALDFDDSSGSGGGHIDPWHEAQTGIEYYERWSSIIAYVLFGMAFLHLCRTIMGCYVQPDQSELDVPLYMNISSRDAVDAARQRNKWTRNREAAMRDGAPAGVDDSGEINIQDKSSCVIS